MSTNRILKFSIVFFISVLIFHFCVLFGIIDFKIVWGGRLESNEQMYVFESISIIINSFCLYLLLEQLQVCKQRLSLRFHKFMMMSLSVLFAVNTVGNLASLNSLETKIFTPLTFIFSICFFYLGKQIKNESKKIDIKV